MSGLLQRLAARATGSAWALRSDARLPFAAATAGMAQEQDAAPPEPAGAMGAAAAQRSAVAPQPAPPMAARAHDPALIATHTAPMAAVREPAADTVPQPAPVTKARAAKEPQQPPMPDGAMHASRPAPASEPAMVSATTPWPNPPAAPADPRPLLAARAEGGAVNAQGQPSPADRATPAGTPRAPHALPALRQPAATAARPAEPAEVHVHIGRIEVTAVAAPQQPQRPARERAQPLSLDAYLQQRKEPS